MNASQQLLDKIKEEYHSGRLVLPSLPEIVIKVRAVVNDDDADLGKIVKMIQVDPSITARLVQIANSPLYRTGKPVENCLMAVNRLGLKVTRDLVTCLAMNNVFKAEQPALRKRVKDLWQHSCHVAAIASTIAKVTPDVNHDMALLAGLLHDIGVLPVLHYVSDYPELIESEQELDAVIQAVRGILGQKILETWNFDSAIVNVPTHAEDWQRDTGEVTDYSDVVIVAQRHSHFGTVEKQDMPDLVAMPAFTKLSLSKLGPDASMEVLFEAEQDVRDIMNMLN